MSSNFKLQAKENVVEAIKRTLEKLECIKLAYVFGSYAWGKPQPGSDIDIAVIVEDRRCIAEASAMIAKELDIPEEKVSIVDMDFLDNSLKLKVLSKGVKVVDKGIRLSTLIPQSIMHELIDIMEQEEVTSINWLKGNPIDLEVLRDIIAAITEDVEDLKEIYRRSLEEVLNNKLLRKTLERTVYTLIESMIDLLRHVIAGLNLGIASYYKDYVDIAREKKVISEKTAEIILQIIPIRHILAHRYRKMNYRELWSAIPKIIEVAERIQVEVREYLRKTLEHNLNA